jgi:hypothetical protein
MRSISNLGARPAGLPVVADDILELHAARLLLLFRVCGVNNRINGLTKMAKLDFFVRYPQFFREVCAYLGVEGFSRTRSVESSMVRYRYGPWDQRYYHVLAYLEGKKLISVRKQGNAYEFELTEGGKAAAEQLRKRKSFAQVVAQMRAVKDVLGGKNGSALKKLVYEAFEEEVSRKPMGEVIS